MQTRASKIIADLLVQLMSIAQDKDLHPKLTPDQTEFLTKIPGDIRPVTIDKLTSVIHACGGKSPHKLVNIYLKRSGRLDGVEYRRLAVVDFPLLEAKTSDELKIFGVNIETKRDKNAIIKLFEWLLPGADAKEFYYGSQDLSAPGFLALCGAYAKLMNRLNKVIATFSQTGLIEDSEYLITPMGWVDGLANIDRYRAAIPTLAGNEGDPVESEIVPVMNPNPLPSSQPHSQPQTLTIVTEPTKRSFKDYITPINQPNAEPRKDQPYGQNQGTVYKETPPAPPAPPKPAQLPVWQPTNYPQNAGYYPQQQPQSQWAPAAPAHAWTDVE